MTPLYQKATDHILNEMAKNLSSKLVYHALSHTQKVIENTREIASAENVSDNDLSLLLIAAAYHDCGFLETYADHEEEGCRIVAKHLPDFGFDAAAIELIQGMIMATKIPQNSTTHLQKIICDADLHYLGGNNYYAISNRLFEELNLNGKPISEDGWLTMQIGFLKSHQYWTAYAQNHLEPGKQEVLQELIEKRENQ